jgi:hypothetical protein
MVKHAHCRQIPVSPSKRNRELTPGFLLNASAQHPGLWVTPVPSLPCHNRGFSIRLLDVGAPSVGHP